MYDRPPAAPLPARDALSALSQLGPVILDVRENIMLSWKSGRISCYPGSQGEYNVILEVRGNIMLSWKSRGISSYPGIWGDVSCYPGSRGDVSFYP